MKYFLAFGVILAGGYVAGNFFGNTANGISPEFKEARLEGAIIAQDVVNLSNDLSHELERVNKLDREGKYNEALEGTIELLKRTKDVKDRAIDLSSQLEKMTGALATIKDADARAAALESIANRLAIIGRLISYSDYLSQLLTELGSRFRGDQATRQRVQSMIAQINAEVTAINSFNSQAGRAMDRFDEILKEE